MTLSQSIQLRDGMTGVLKNMNQALNLTISGFERMQTAAGRDMPVRELQLARDKMSSIGAEIKMAEQRQNQYNNAVQRGAKANGGLLSMVKRVAVAVGGLAAAKGVVGLSDQLAQTTARLNLMNDGLRTTAELQNLIQQSAQRSRGAYLQTADAVAKMGLRAGGIFKNNAETVAFVEQLNKQFVIAGASQEEMSSATLQLTQALGSGVLRGEEFNAVFEAAPNIMQTLADYIGKPIGSLREMAAEGELSATLIKNALFSAADATNAKFESMPMTWGQRWTWFCNLAMQKFEPVLQRINDFANSDKFVKFGENVANIFASMANAAISALDIIASSVNFVADTWSALEPVIWGVVGALAAHTAALAVHKGMLILATIAQNGLNLSMLACPLFWIPAVIGIVIAAIAKGIQYVGGMKHAFDVLKMTLTLVGMVFELFAMKVQYGAMEIWGAIQTLGENIKWCLAAACTAVENSFIMMQASVISSIQNTVNGAIELINGLVRNMVSIPGVELPVIGKVTFGDDAMNVAKAQMAQNNQGLSRLGASNATQRALRASQQADRLSAIDTKFRAIGMQALNIRDTVGLYHSQTLAGKKTKDEMASDFDLGFAADAFSPDMLGAAKDAAANTGRMADAMDISEEDLKYLRDIAEREVVNRFTTTEIKLDMTNYNTVNGEQDIDGIVQTLGEKLHEMMIVSAEGVHA